MILVYIMAFYGTCHALAWLFDEIEEVMHGISGRYRRLRNVQLPGERLIERVK